MSFLAQPDPPPPPSLRLSDRPAFENSFSTIMSLAQCPMVELEENANDPDFTCIDQVSSGPGRLFDFSMIYWRVDAGGNTRLS